MQGGNITLHSILVKSILDIFRYMWRGMFPLHSILVKSIPSPHNPTVAIAISFTFHSG